MCTNNVRRLDDEVVNRLKCCAVENGVAGRVKSFRALARSLRERTAAGPQTPAHVLIREDRDGGHGSA